MSVTSLTKDCRFVSLIGLHLKGPKYYRVGLVIARMREKWNWLSFQVKLMSPFRENSSYWQRSRHVLKIYKGAASKWQKWWYMQQQSHKSFFVFHLDLVGCWNELLTVCHCWPHGLFECDLKLSNLLMIWLSKVGRIQPYSYPTNFFVFCAIFLNISSSNVFFLN